MNASDVLQTRTDFAKTVAQKSEAMRVEVERESFRLEGAQGCLAQVIDVLSDQQNTVAQQFKESGADESLARARTEVLTTAIRACQGLLDKARGQHLVARGRLSQCEATLDMMEAIFTADLANARIAVARAEAADHGEGAGHPGPSLADQRRAEAAAIEETKDGADSGPP